jgi:hypothetical protein
MSSASIVASSNKYDKVSQPSVRARRASSLVSSPIYWAEGRGLSLTMIGLMWRADMGNQEAAGGEGLGICKTVAILHEPRLICTGLQTFFFLIAYQYRPAQMISSGAVQFVRPHAWRRRNFLPGNFLAGKFLAGKFFAGRMRRCAFR